MPRRLPIIGLVLVLGLGLAGGTLLLGRLLDRAPAPAIGGPFSLVDGAGRTVTDASFRGKWVLVYFGYSHCPDACPTTLAQIAAALDALGPLAARVQPLFITVDPERDHGAALAQYTAAFDKRIRGLTGSAAQIKAAAAAYKIYYAKRPASGGDYGIDHSSVIFVMDPEGRYADRFGDASDGERIAARLRRLITG